MSKMIRLHQTAAQHQSGLLGCASTGLKITFSNAPLICDCHLIVCGRHAHTHTHPCTQTYTSTHTHMHSKGVRAIHFGSSLCDIYLVTSLSLLSLNRTNLQRNRVREGEWVRERASKKEGLCFSTNLSHHDLKKVCVLEMKRSVRSKSSETKRLRKKLECRSAATFGQSVWLHLNRLWAERGRTE